MSKTNRAMGYLLAGNFQAFAVLGFSFWVGEYLNENHPTNFNWVTVCVVVGLLAAVHCFYLVIKSLIRLEARDKQARNREN